MTNIKSIRDRILKERGLTTTRSDVTKHKQISRTLSDVKVHKTPLMKFLEMKYGENIVTILSSGSLNYIEKTYNIDRTTASKWRKRICEELETRLED